MPYSGMQVLEEAHCREQTSRVPEGEIEAPLRV